MGLTIALPCAENLYSNATSYDLTNHISLSFVVGLLSRCPVSWGMQGNVSCLWLRNAGGGGKKTENERKKDRQKPVEE